jgi:glycosyltransferase involved in cell wall biosynthesis
VKISVIVRTYNRPDLLKEALASVKLQSHTDWEVIIFDDSASDVNFNIYKDFKSQNPKNDVLYHTSNTPYDLFKNSWKIGAKLANGELIVRLDDDDLLVEDTLEYLSNTYTQHTELDFSYGSAVFFENTTLQHAAKLSIVEDKPIMLDYWTNSLDKTVLIGVKDNNDKEKLLVKSEEEYTSPISKIFKVGKEYIIMTENSIYIVDVSIPTKRITS